MVRKFLAVLSSVTFASSLAAGPNTTSSPAKISAAEIVDKNVAARGGLQAWRAVRTLSLAGKMGVGGNQRATLSVPMPGGQRAQRNALKAPQRPVDEVQLPFVMELARPHKLRLELEFKGQTAIQVYDGSQGWKVRPFLNRMEVEPYTNEEAQIASAQQDLDGPLVDYAAKGTKIALDGMEKVEDRDTYKLKLTLKTGQQVHVWVDAQTFLEAKMEGQPRRLDGTAHPVELYYRDYRAVSGLEIPFVLETRVLPVAKTALGLRDTPVPPEKIIIEKVTVNPQLDDARFSKPQVAVASKAK